MKKRFSIIMMVLAVVSTPFIANEKMEITAQEISYDDPSLEQGAPVTVRYLDTDGYDIVESTVLNGVLYDYYNSTPIDIIGYELVQIPYNATGPFLEEPQEVVYIYQRLAGAPVSVRYLDIEDNEIEESRILNGNLYDTYDSQPLSIDNYELVQTPYNATGNFLEEPQEVIYVYQKVNDDNSEEDIDDIDKPTENDNTDESIGGNDTNEDDKFTINPDVDVISDGDIDANTDHNTIINDKTITFDKKEVVSSREGISTSVSTGDTTNKGIIITLLLSSAILTAIVGTKKFKARNK